MTAFSAEADLFEAVPAMLAAGLRPKQIAGELGVHKDRVYRARQKLKLAPGRNWRKLQVCRLVAGGARTAPELAAALRIPQRHASALLFQAYYAEMIEIDGRVVSPVTGRPLRCWRVKAASASVSGRA